MTTEPSDNRDPLVTVIITTYNRPTYLPKAVESVRTQTYDPVELVVVDDHSTEPAQPIVTEADLSSLQNVECIRHEENRGANAARNTGIEASSGEYIAFLDDDDRWHPEKITRQVEAFERTDDVGFVYTGEMIGTRARNEVAVENIDGEINIPPLVTGDMTKTLLCRNVVGTLSKVMVRADIARAVPFDEHFPVWADLEWYINVSLQTTFLRIPEPLVVFEYSAHNRLTDNFEKKRVGYERFLEEFDQLATQYGRLFRRKMRGWAAFRIGASAMQNERYDQARQLLTTAIRRYPLEPRFFKYWVATLGGRYTHELARTADRILN
ncbi:glycosyltransferase [Halovenus marina]|uniref:glycosyltransferase n=1 Tax=Halovenus marina TaxID=3396621 RepID=UPI003F573ED7